MQDVIAKTLGQQTRSGRSFQLPICPRKKTTFATMEMNTQSSPSTNCPILCDKGTCAEENKQFSLHNIGAHFATELNNAACSKSVLEAVKIACKHHP